MNENPSAAASQVYAHVFLHQTVCSFPINGCKPPILKPFQKRTVRILSYLLSDGP
jgi:hypothetical protein